MSVTSQEPRWAASAENDPRRADAPSVLPNRRCLDKASGSIAFTIVATKPFVEVVLTTDRTLFDPRNAASRTPHNFFASRSMGLSRLSGHDTTYIVPSAVVAAFLEYEPRPREIFYTAVGYDDAAGAGPVLAQELAELLSHAPSVSVARDFSVHGLSRAFGTALGRLVRHEGSTRDLIHPSNGANGAASTSNALAAPTAAPGASRWSASGEIRLPVGQGMAMDDAPSLGPIDDDGLDRSPPPPRAAAVDDRDDRDDRDDQSAKRSMGDGHGERSPTKGEALAYDDGFGQDLETGDSDDDRPAGAEPAELVEDEYASTYGDEADEDPGARGMAANGSPPASPGGPAAATTPGGAPPVTALRGVLDRVARTLDGRSLYRLARATHHAGVRFGVGSFDQQSGALGQLAARMKAADASAFQRIFGQSADELIAVTGAATPEGRMASVGGKPLHDRSWLDRFEQAGGHPPFVDVQNELLVGSVLAPMWTVVNGLGLTSERAIAIALVVGIQMGAHEAAAWLASRLGAVQTKAQLQQALAALGVQDLTAFQGRVGLPATGQGTAETSAALTGALRRLGAASPVPVLEPIQMLQAVKRHLSHEGVGRKLAALLDDHDLGDVAR